MALQDEGAQTGIILTTAFATFITGFMFGIFTSRGYLISPALTEERRRNHTDPVESDESDIDEDDTILDHAPNWANGEEADRKQGLKVAAAAAAAADEKKKKNGANKVPVPKDMGEECKLVLVVRTDLGMTKGMYLLGALHSSQIVITTSTIILLSALHIL